MKDSSLEGVGFGFIFLAFIRAADIMFPPSPSWGKCFVLIVIGFITILLARRS